MFKNRAIEETEIMDDLSMEGDLLAETLEEINLINRFLGGHRIVIGGLKKILAKQKNNFSTFIPTLKGERGMSAKKTKSYFCNLFPSNTSLKIADLGCGGGDTLNAIEKWANKQRISLQLYGIDANAFTLQYAQKHTSSNIQYLQQNIFSSNCSFEGYDIIICSLFLHHFNETEISQFFQKCQSSNVKVLLINDLQRHWLPYALFKFITWVLRATPMTKADGLLSIRKGFTRNELKSIFQKNDIENYALEWKWAFRYQAICFF